MHVPLSTLTHSPILRLRLLPGLPNAILYATMHCCLLRHTCLYNVTRRDKTLPSRLKTKCTSQWENSVNLATNYPLSANCLSKELVRSRWLNELGSWHIDWISLPIGRGKN